MNSAQLVRRSLFSLLHIFGYRSPLNKCALYFSTLPSGLFWVCRSVYTRQLFNFLGNQLVPKHHFRSKNCIQCSWLHSIHLWTNFLELLLQFEVNYQKISWRITWNKVIHPRWIFAISNRSFEFDCWKQITFISSTFWSSLNWCETSWTFSHSDLIHLGFVISGMSTDLTIPILIGSVSSTFLCCILQ